MMLTAIITLAIFTICQFCAGEDIPCGTQAPGNEPIGGNSQQYIGGGIHAKPHSWPWAAAILGNDGQEPLEHCGGTVIDKRWILTAGHCAGTVGLSHIKLGADDRGPTFEPNEPTQQIYTAEKVIVNPQFNPATLEFDMTLVKLDRDIEFNDNIRPVCLPEATDLLPAGEWVTTIGWGLREAESPPEHRELQQLKLPVKESKVCNDLIHQEIGDQAISVLDTCMVCAGYDDVNNATGIYGGDSGSSLVAFHGGVWKQYGVTSWRYRYGPPYMPGVWAYVPKMVHWIKQTIQSN